MESRLFSSDPLYKRPGLFDHTLKIFLAQWRRDKLFNPLCVTNMIVGSGRTWDTNNTFSSTDLSRVKAFSFNLEKTAARFWGNCILIRIVVHYQSEEWTCLDRKGHPMKIWLKPYLANLDEWKKGNPMITKDRNRDIAKAKIVGHKPTIN